MPSRKITVIGAGAVGSATAFALAIKNIASEIVIVDINEEKAKGEAMDIRQATPLMSKPVDIYAGTYAAAAGSDIVVITSGVGRKPGQTRLDLVNTNVEILKNIAPRIVEVCPDATYVIVANPVDILTYVFCKITNIPSAPVLCWIPPVCVPVSQSTCPCRRRMYMLMFSASTARPASFPGPLLKFPPLISMITKR